MDSKKRGARPALVGVFHWRLASLDRRCGCHLHRYSMYVDSNDYIDRAESSLYNPQRAPTDLIQHKGWGRRFSSSNPLPEVHCGTQPLSHRAPFNASCECNRYMCPGFRLWSASGPSMFEWYQSRHRGRGWNGAIDCSHGANRVVDLGRPETIIRHGCSFPPSPPMEDSHHTCGGIRYI